MDHSMFLSNRAPIGPAINIPVETLPFGVTSFSARAGVFLGPQLIGRLLI